MSNLALKKSNMKNIFAGLLLIVSSFTYAQDSSYSPFSIQLNFTPVPVLQAKPGDTSFQNGLSIAPGIDIRSRKGWGINYSAGLISSAEKNGIYMHNLTLGYERYGKSNFDLAFGFSHYFFT